MVKKTSTKKPPVKKQDEIQQYLHFPSIVYKINKTEFLKTVNKVSEEYLEKAKKEYNQNIGQLNEIYPVYMTGNYWQDPRIQDFSMYVLNTGWEILNNQGYDMANYNTYFSEMWTQEHYKHSSMEQHVHGFGSQLVAFYFLETPTDCSRIVLHDPRPGKVQINLPEANMQDATIASSMINFVPEPGDLFFTNAYVAHSFTRHANNTLPIKFVHMNIYVQWNGQTQQCEMNNSVEVI